MTGFIRQVSGETRKQKAAEASLDRSFRQSEVEKVEPPTLADTQVGAKDELMKQRRQRGRAATIFRGIIGDDSTQQSMLNVKDTLGA